MISESSENGWPVVRNVILFVCLLISGMAVEATKTSWKSQNDTVQIVRNVIKDRHLSLSCSENVCVCAQSRAVIII